MSQPGKQAKIGSGKSLLVGLLLASLCLLGTGCDMKLPPMPWDPKPKPKDAAEAGADAAAEGDGGGDAAEPVQVNELDFLPPDMKKLPFEEVNITLSDGMVIYGRLYDPSQKLQSDDTPAEGDAKGDSSGDQTSGDGEYKGPKYPLVILLHGIDRDHTTWSDLPVSLVKAGYSVFAMDLRGHGKSTQTVHQQRVTWRFFQPEQWLLLPKDVDQIIQHFQKDEEHPQIDGKTVALVGEKLGANVAVFSGRDMLQNVKAMVLISPGLNYKGIIPSQAIIDYTNPALLITTQDDPYSYKSTERLYNWLLGVKAMQVYKKIGDGSDMLSHQTALGENITEWLIGKMPSPEKPKAADKMPEPAQELGKEESKTEAGPNKASEAKPDAKPSAESEKSKAATKADLTGPSTRRVLPKGRLGQADNSPAKSSTKKPSAKAKPAHSTKNSGKTAHNTTSKSAPTPPTSSNEKGASPSTGQPPIPGG